MMDNAVITITTDFGLSDGYIAAVKGVILSINSKANLVDIAHNIPPQNIEHAAFILNSAYKFFPKDTIHIVCAFHIEYMMYSLKCTIYVVCF